MKQVPAGYADHCITDPPYNISGYDNKKQIGWLNSNKYWQDSKRFNKINADWDKFSNETYNTLLVNWLDEITRIVKPNGNIIIFGTYHNIFKIGSVLQKMDRKIINSIVWYKRNAFPNITQRMLCESTEYIIWGVNNSQQKAKNWIFNYSDLKKLNTIKVCTRCRNSSEINVSFCSKCGDSSFTEKNIQMRNVWNFPTTPISEKTLGKHPSQKPLKILDRLIVGCSNPKDLIIDPFVGSGSTGVSAKRLDRNFIGVDSDKNYLKIAEKRLNSTHRST